MPEKEDCEYYCEKCGSRYIENPVNCENCGNKVEEVKYEDYED